MGPWQRWNCPLSLRFILQKDYKLSKLIQTHNEWETWSGHRMQCLWIRDRVRLSLEKQSSGKSSTVGTWFSQNRSGFSAPLLCREVSGAIITERNNMFCGCTEMWTLQIKIFHFIVHIVLLFEILNKNSPILSTAALETYQREHPQKGMISPSPPQFYQLSIDPL